MQKLNNKQKLFCEYYLGECLSNATQAAIAAGYSKKTARVIGCQNLKKQNIKDYISKRSKKLFGQIRDNHFKTIYALNAIANFNIKDTFDKDGNLINILDLPREIAFGIASYKKKMWKKGGEWNTVCSVKSVDKLKALEMLIKMQKLREDSISEDITINIGFEN